MAYVRVAGTADVAPGAMIPVEAGGVKLLLANVDGTFHAASRKCPHLGLNLCRGHIEDGAVVCMFHKAKFDLVTGKVKRDPRLLFIGMKAKADLPVYPVRIEGSDVLVEV